MDQARVGRAGDTVAQGCFGTPLRTQATPDLAAFLRDNPPTRTAPGGAFNMADVLQSSLALDDLRPYYLTNLFARMGRPIPLCKNVTDVDNDTGRRRAFSNAFEATYLRRSNDCASCHNADGSPTETSDPATNRFWPVPGQYETALWGAPSGRDPNQTQAPFRFMGVLHPPAEPSPLVSGDVLPWGMNQGCGIFYPPSTIGPDPAGFDGYLGGELGKSASIWDLEQELATGFSKEAGGLLPADPLDGPHALAGLVAQTIAHDVWTEVMGSPLEMAHYFPRSEASRNTLKSLADTVVCSNYSLKSLLVAIVTNPLFNVQAPASQTSSTEYPLQPVFYPTSVDELTPDEWGNGTGDRVHRATARVMLRSVSVAMGWPAAPGFPMVVESTFQETLGAPLDQDRTGQGSADFQGLLDWEARYGPCTEPLLPPATGATDAPSMSISGSCAGNCGQPQIGVGMNGTICSCDDSCTGLNNCCPDYATACPLPAPTPDWLDSLAQAADGWAASHPTDPLTFRDVVLAEKDHLITEPVTRPDEEALTAPLFGVASLDAPLPPSAEWLPSARWYCGVLLKTPQFLMRGLPGAVQEGPPPRLAAPGGDAAGVCSSLLPGIKSELHAKAVCSSDGVLSMP